MTPSARERMVQSAVVLLAKRGFQGASFTEVLAHSRAPRGSIYHHFPDGKEQLIAAAVDYAGARAVLLLDALSGRSAAEIVDGFMAMWRAVLERSGFTAGCSVLAVTVSADSAVLLDRAGQVFRSWQARLTELLAAAGLADGDADGLATMMIAASEGAVVLARAEQSLAPLETVCQQLRALAQAYGPAGDDASREAGGPDDRSRAAGERDGSSGMTEAGPAGSAIIRPADRWEQR